MVGLKIKEYRSPLVHTPPFVMLIKKVLISQGTMTLKQMMKAFKLYKQCMYVYMYIYKWDKNALFL